MAHVSMRLEEAVRDADPVEVTISSNVLEGRGKIDGLPETKASSLPPPPSPHLATPSLRRTIWKVNRMSCNRRESRFLTDGKKNLFMKQIQLITAEVISKSLKSSRDVIFTSLRISLSGKVQEMKNLLVKGKGFPTCRQGNWTTSIFQSTHPQACLSA